MDAKVHETSLYTDALHHPTQAALLRTPAATVLASLLFGGTARPSVLKSARLADSDLSIQTDEFKKIFALCGGPQTPRCTAARCAFAGLLSCTFAPADCKGIVTAHC